MNFHIIVELSTCFLGHDICMCTILFLIMMAFNLCACPYFFRFTNMCVLGQLSALCICMVLCFLLFSFSFRFTSLQYLACAPCFLLTELMACDVDKPYFFFFLSTYYYFSVQFRTRSFSLRMVYETHISISVVHVRMCMPGAEVLCYCRAGVFSCAYLCVVMSCIYVCTAITSYR